MKDLISAIFSKIPCGVGEEGKISLSPKEERDVLLKGSAWAVENGYGIPRDLEYTEERGGLKSADPNVVSSRAFTRGKRQLGTLGSGNHFLEVQKVDRIFDQEASKTMGLEEDQITIMIHSGSRGLGHQVCDDFLREWSNIPQKYGFQLPDRQLVCAPVNSKDGQRYLAAMACAANYAWANRQCLMHWTREVFQNFFSMSADELGLELIYDVAHNMAKLEEHVVNGVTKKLCVHRKGATRAFPPGHPEIPAKYQPIGQPVIIPGDMGTASYILVGTQKAMEETFGSTCHGAGRIMSRTAAKKATKGRPLQRELEDQGIFVKARGRTTLQEEAPEAYKDVDEVVKTAHEAGISKRVARMTPLAVMKG
jgi:tRNA-splicing ligase RtcB